MKKAIYTFAFFSFLFGLTANSNPFFYKLLIACAGLFLILDSQYKPQLLHLLYFAWIIWAAICCASSQHSQVSLLGYHLRGEGLLTYLIITLVATIYWTVWDNEKPLKYYSVATLIITAILYCVLSNHGFMNIAFTNASMASLISIIAIILWSIRPWCLIFIAPFFMFTSSRSLIVAIIAGLLTCILFKKGWKHSALHLTWIIPIASIIIAVTPLYDKVSKIDFERLGQGARSQWARQAIEHSQRLPLTGYGLDTLSKHLKPATQQYYHINATCDRTHNIILDSILMTGWIGFGISLFMFLAALRTTYFNQTDQNILFFSMIIAWLAFNMFNPSGIYSTMFAVLALFGIREKEEAL